MIPFAAVPNYGWMLRGINAQTGSYTLVLADAGKEVQLTTTTAPATLTVPPNSSVPFKIGTTVAVYQGGFGGVIVAPGSGVTINSPFGRLGLFKAGSWAVLRKVGTDTWELSGDLVFVPAANLLAKSEDFGNAVWTKDNVTVSTNTTTAPDGQTTADSILETTATAYHGIYQTITQAAARTLYTFSVFAKMLGRTTIALGGGGTTGYVNDYHSTEAGIMLAAAYCYQDTDWIFADAGAAIFGNGWIRHWSTFVTGAEASPYASVYPRLNYNTGSYAGNTSMGAYLWGAQLVPGTEPGLYRQTL